MTSLLFEQATRKKRPFNETNKWHTFQCLDCFRFFTMKLEYDIASFPYWSKSTKQCNHNNAIEIGAEKND